MNTIITKLSTVIIAILICNISLAQIKFKINQIEEKNYFAVLDESTNYTTSEKNIITVLKQITESNEKINYKFLSSYNDNLNFTHKKYGVYYNNIEIKGMDFVIHEKNDIIALINGTFENLKDINTKPIINESSATEVAEKYYYEITKNITNKVTLQNKEYCIISNPLQKVITYELAYKILVNANDPFAKYIYVSANSGKIITYEHLNCTTNAPGTAETRYSGTQNFTTDLQGSHYRLRQVRNGVNIRTLNANNQSDETTIVNIAGDFWDFNDNNWQAVEHGNNRIATDAHWGMEKTFDYWFTQHNRNSINNAGIDITSYIHVGSNMDNAYWSNSLNSMFFGDGNSFFRPLTSLDVCAHELGHGICQYTSNLSYAFGTESSALNEGFSDIWGASVEAWAAPTKQRWLIGEEITLTSPFFLRSMSAPKTGAFTPSEIGRAHV